MCLGAFRANAGYDGLVVGAGLGRMMSSLSAPGDMSLALLLAVLAAAALLLGGGWVVRRMSPSIAETPWSHERSRGFKWAFGTEAAAIIVIVTVALLLHRPF